MHTHADSYRDIAILGLLWAVAYLVALWLA